VARATEEVKAQIESLRPYIVSNFLASARLRGDPPRATVTIDSTFDRHGREIARGVSEDRRAPAGELAACLRQLQGVALSISPPGANVGVRVPVAFP
jgi:hypothetical protein